MDDTTALWLLSALLQSTATILSINLFISIFWIRQMYLEDKIDHQTRWLAMGVLKNNVWVIIALFSSMAGLIFFRNDALIQMAVLFMSLSVLNIFYFIFNFTKGIITKGPKAEKCRKIKFK